MSKTQSSYSTEFPTLCWHLSIFPGRLHPSIFDTNELNFRVRYGNGCTLIDIDTNYFVFSHILQCVRMVTRSGFEPLLSA